MIKRLSLLRHAQTADKQTGQSDKQRELSSKGRIDVAKIGHAIKKLNINFDLVISSTAFRAKSTSLLLVETLGMNTDLIEWNDEIYEASVNRLLQVVTGINPQSETPLLVGHNPSISYVVRLLTGDEMTDLPPAGLASIQFEIDDWKEVTENSGDLILRLDPPNPEAHQ